MKFKLNINDRIGIIAPSNYFEKDSIELGLSYLKKQGFQVVLGKNIYKRHRWMAGTELERASDINAFYKDNSIKAIFCACGGAGSQKVLDCLDYDIIKKNPKPIFGFSDNTSLQMGIYSRTKQISYTGLTLRFEFNDGNVSSFVDKSLKQIFSGKKQIIKSGETIISGKAEGILVGGTLVCFFNLFGTKYFPNLSGKILLIEDIDEKVYKIDLMLDALKKLPNFNKIKGIIFGKFVDCKIEKVEQGSVDEVLDYFCKELKIPIIKNFDYGHIKDKYVLPIGKKVVLDSTNCILEA